MKTHRLDFDFPKKESHGLGVSKRLSLLFTYSLLMNINNKRSKDRKVTCFFTTVPPFLSILLRPNCLTICLTSAFLLHVPSSLSPCGYLWPGMCSTSQRARALVMCGCRRPPSPIAPADITDNYSITTVKTWRCHTQSRSA